MLFPLDRYRHLRRHFRTPATDVVVAVAAVVEGVAAFESFAVVAVVAVETVADWHTGKRCTQTA